MISSYESTLIRNNNVKYVGPKSLFDPNFVPPKILPRKKQARLIHGLIMDALDDGYSSSINLYGLKGSGKNLQINHFFKWLVEYQKDCIEETAEHPFYLTRVDCERKNMSQIFFNILENAQTFLDRQFDAEKIFEADLSALWNLFQFIISRLKSPLILYLQKAEHIENQYLDKIYAFAKQNRNLQIITTMNTGSRRYLFKNYENLDQKIQFSTYNLSELAEITRDRSEMAFNNPIEQEKTDLVVDYVTEFSHKVPGECVNILKDIYYPIVQNDWDISSEYVRKQTQYYFDNVSIDVFCLTDFIQKTNFEEQLFLEYLLGFFQNRDIFYIPFGEVKNAYKMTSEEIGFEIKWEDFYETLKKFIRSNIILPNNLKSSIMKTNFHGIYEVPYFLPIPANEIDELLKYIFGMLDEKFID